MSSFVLMFSRDDQLPYAVVCITRVWIIIVRSR